MSPPPPPPPPSPPQLLCSRLPRRRCIRRGLPHAARRRGGVRRVLRDGRDSLQVHRNNAHGCRCRCCCCRRRRRHRRRCCFWPRGDRCCHCNTCTDAPKPDTVSPRFTSQGRPRNRYRPAVFIRGLKFYFHSLFLLAPASLAPSERRLLLLLLLLLLLCRCGRCWCPCSCRVRSLEGPTLLLHKGRHRPFLHRNPVVGNRHQHHDDKRRARVGGGVRAYITPPYKTSNLFHFICLHGPSLHNLKPVSFDTFFLR